MSGVWKQRISDEDNNIPGGRKLGPGPDIRLSELELDNMRTDNCELRLNIVMRMWGMLTLWHGDTRGCDVTGPVISGHLLAQLTSSDISIWSLIGSEWVTGSQVKTSFIIFELSILHLFQYLSKILCSLKLLIYGLRPHTSHPIR